MTEVVGAHAPGANPEPEEIALAIRSFQAGEGREAAFRLLYETYFPALRRYFLRRGLAADDALDLTQETFFGIYRGLEGYEERQRFAAWLYRVAETRYLKWVRSGAAAKRAAVTVASEEVGELTAPAAAEQGQLSGVLLEERRRAVSEAVSELPEQMRQCLALRLGQELSYREIAVVKRISVETVKAHLARAKRKLTEKLRDFDWGRLEDGEDDGPEAPG